MYGKLAIALLINAIIMFLLTYIMIFETDHFYFNINRVYMALLMVAPMVIVMLIVMGDMYENKKLNYILIAAFGGLFILLAALIRTQQPVGDTQFLRSMIPHHSSAVLMCREAEITDPEILKLCEQIIKSQNEEITQMKTILERK
jgi:hypothetical protein